MSRLNWDEAKRPHAARLAVLIGDAPPHGIEGAIYKDAFPQGRRTWVLSTTCAGNFFQAVQMVMTGLFCLKRVAQRTSLSSR